MEGRGGAGGQNRTRHKALSSFPYIYVKLHCSAMSADPSEEEGTGVGARGN